MVTNELLNRDELSFDEWAVTPAPEHLVPDAIEHERESEWFHEQLRIGNSESYYRPVILTHTDADGLSAAALLVAHLGGIGEASVRPVSYHGAYQFEDALSDLLDTGFNDTPIYITDFSPDAAAVPDDLETLIHERECPVYWIDHHEWPYGTLAAHREAGINASVDTTECATSLIHRLFYDENGGWPDRITELAAVTKDIDLWIRDDPRSPRLNTFASIVDDPFDYINNVLEHGVKHPPDVEQQIDERIARDEELEAFAVENATKYATADDPWTVAITYSKGGRSSEIGNELCENPEHDVDIAIVLKTHGGAGVYSHSDGQGDDPDPGVFSRCHEIASEFGGGGHPTAAGFSVPVENFRDLAEYWASASGTVRPAVLQACYDVFNETEGNR
jgi:oligoribonuclease NrnB/cAMP/cGMP phosphodiesterase (DHH superfamily)